MRQPICTRRQRLLTHREIGCRVRYGESGPVRPASIDLAGNHRPGRGLGLCGLLVGIWRLKPDSVSVGTRARRTSTTDPGRSAYSAWPVAARVSGPRRAGGAGCWTVADRCAVRLMRAGPAVSRGPGRRSAVPPEFPRPSPAGVPVLADRAARNGQGDIDQASARWADGCEILLDL